MDTKKMMEKYALQSNMTVSLEKRLAQEMADDVKKSVARAQQFSDSIVNALTRKAGPDFETVKEKLESLLSAPPVLVTHWQPFIDEVCRMLPASMQLEPAEHIPDVDHAGHDVHALEHENEELRAKVIEHEKTHASLRQKLAEKEADVQKMKDSVAAFEAKLAEVVKSHEEAKATLAAMQKALDEKVSKKKSS